MAISPIVLMNGEWVVKEEETYYIEYVVEESSEVKLMMIKSR